MADRSRSEIIRDNPVGKGLDAFHTSFNSICEDKKVPRSPDALGRLDQEVIRAFLRAAQNLPAVDLLPAKTSRGTLRDDLLRLELSLRSDDFDFNRVKPLLNAALADAPDDTDIWDQVDRAVAESTPPPRPVPSSSSKPHGCTTQAVSQTPQNTARMWTGSLGRNLVLSTLGFLASAKHFFGRVAGLHIASEAVWNKCTEGSNPPFGNEGWSGWPAGAKENDRGGKLATLQEKLFIPKKCQNAAIVGLDGVGKPRLALQLAYWAKQHRPEYSIFWVHMLSGATFEQAYKEIARKLRLQDVGTDEDPKDSVRRYLSSEAAGPWLLVVDNADDADILFGSPDMPSGLTDYLPESEAGLVLFTTRPKKVAVSVAGSDVVELSGMDPQKAADYLEKLLINLPMARRHSHHHEGSRRKSADADPCSTRGQQKRDLDVQHRQAAYKSRHKFPSLGMIGV
ncbi:hypothetical protein RB597_008976 [Gaeumannomyces tritici]